MGPRRKLDKVRNVGYVKIRAPFRKEECPRKGGGVWKILPLQSFGLLVGKELFKVQQISDASCLEELKVTAHVGRGQGHGQMHSWLNLLRLERMREGTHPRTNTPNFFYINHDHHHHHSLS